MEKCRYAKNANAVSLSDAVNKGLTLCSVCNPGSGSETESVTGTEKNSLTGDEQITKPSSEQKQTKGSLYCNDKGREEV